MFRRIFGIGLLIFLLMGVFGGFSNRSRAAYYEGYSDGLQAQAAEEGSDAVPPAVPYRDGHGRGGFLGWAALSVLGFFAIFFKIGFFFLLAMIFIRLIFGRRGRHRGGRWGRGPWGDHHKRGHHSPGREKSPKWVDNSDDDEPIMTV